MLVHLLVVTNILLVRVCPLGGDVGWVTLVALLAALGAQLLLVQPSHMPQVVHSLLPKHPATVYSIFVKTMLPH